MWMNFEHPNYVAIVILKWQRSSIMGKISIVFSIAVTTSVELLSIMILMGQGISIWYLQR
jgi:hypothetical protein